jgi:hypothetical protein
MYPKAFSGEDDGRLKVLKTNSQAMVLKLVEQVDTKMSMHVVRIPFVDNGERFG